MTRIIPLALAIGTLIACGKADLTGSWSGELDCESDGTESTIDVAFDLMEDDKDAFSGDTEASTSVEFQAQLEGGVVVTIGVMADLAGTVEATTDGRGEQEIDFDVDFEDLDCDVTLNGSPFQNDCGAVGLTVDDLAFGDDVEVTWDGEDTLTFEDDTCEGAIER